MQFKTDQYIDTINMSGANLSNEYVTEEHTDMLRSMVQLLKLRAPEEDPEGTPILERLERGLKIPDTVEEKLSDIEFVIPAQSLSDWFNELVQERTAPRKNIHYTDENGVLSKNVNKRSFIKDDQEAGQKARDALAITNPESTRDRLEAEYERAAREARIENDLARAEPKIWELLKRKLPNDIKLEDGEIRYLDQQQKIPDWYNTIKNIKRLGESLGYDEHHYKNVLERFISYFNPSLSVITLKQHPNETAKFLARLTIPESDYDRLTNLLNKLERKTGESLQTVMSHLLAIVNSLYNDIAEPEKGHSISRLMVNGLLTFTTGRTNLDLANTIETNKRLKRPIDWERLLEKATIAEKVNGMPTQSLPFATPGNQSTVLYHVNPLVTSKISNRPQTKPSKIHQVGAPHRKYIPIDVWPEETPKRQQQYRQEPHIAAIHEEPKEEVAQEEEEEQEGAAGEVWYSPEERVRDTQVDQARATTTGGETAQRRVQPDRAAKTGNKVYQTEANQVRDRSQSREQTGNTNKRDRSEDRDRNRKFTPQNKNRDNRNRSYSRDKQQNRSRDNRDKQRGKRQDDEEEEQQEDRRRFRDNRSEDRNRSRSREGRFRGRRDFSRDRRDRGNRSFSRDSRRDRDYTPRRDSWQNNRRDNRRDNWRDRSSSANFTTSRDRQFGRRDRRFTRSFSRDRGRGRSQSSERGRMQPGINCSTTYDPRYTKHCMKCISTDHHEHLCPSYYRVSQYTCPKCKAGKHWPEECQQGRNRSRERLFMSLPQEN